jgi:hypothetical protein
LPVPILPVRPMTYLSAHLPTKHLEGLVKEFYPRRGEMSKQAPRRVKPTLHIID